MEFFNIGGGELLIIVLLAIILFGPEDILKIMRTIGEYTRKIQQMWAQMSAGLKGEFISDELDEVQETINETKASVSEIQKTLADVKAFAEADLNETKAVVEDVKTTLEEMSTSVTDGVEELPKALEATLNEPMSKKTAPAGTSQAPTPVIAVEPESVEVVVPAADTAISTQDISAAASTSATAETHPNDEDE
jgi:sec-independent protein translocase protein TatB